MIAQAAVRLEQEEWRRSEEARTAKASQQQKTIDRLAKDLAHMKDDRDHWRHQAEETQKQLNEAKATRNREAPLPQPGDNLPVPQPGDKIMTDWLILQVAQSQDESQLTLVAKGLTGRMKKLVRYALVQALIQSAPFLAEDDAQDP